jgi:excinuclease ABC subunit A
MTSARKPEGGVKGGEIVAVGTPEQVVTEKRSYTGHYLKPLLEKGSAGVKAETVAAE